MPGFDCMHPPPDLTLEFCFLFFCFHITFFYPALAFNHTLVRTPTCDRQTLHRRLVKQVWLSPLSAVAVGSEKANVWCSQSSQLPASPPPRLLGAPSTNRSCTRVPCHGVNLSVRSRLLEICPSDWVNVRVAGWARVPQGVCGCACARACVCVSVCAPSAIGGGIPFPVSVLLCVGAACHYSSALWWTRTFSSGVADTQGTVCDLLLKM